MCFNMLFKEKLVIGIYLKKRNNLSNKLIKVFFVKWKYPKYTKALALKR